MNKNNEMEKHHGSDLFYPLPLDLQVVVMTYCRMHDKSIVSKDRLMESFTQNMNNEMNKCGKYGAWTRMMK